MSDQYYITVTLSPRERSLILRLLKADDSDLVDALQEQIEHLLREAREDANRRRKFTVRSQRLDAARVVARVFAERHAASFPGSRGGINQNVERWVERQAEVALGVGSDRDLPTKHPSGVSATRSNGFGSAARRIANARRHAPRSRGRGAEAPGAGSRVES